MEPKPKYKTKQGNGRLRFDAIDMLRQARGLPTPEGYVVLTKDFVQFVEDELKRLYAVEDVATEYAEDVEKMHPLPHAPMNDVLEALVLPIPAVRTLSVSDDGDYPAIETSGWDGRIIRAGATAPTAGRDATPVVQNGRQVVDL